MAGGRHFDFDVMVEQRDATLCVRVLRSPAGETTTLSTSLDRLLPHLAGSPAHSGGARPRDVGGTQGATPASRHHTGVLLFETLMTGAVLSRYRESQRRAAVAQAPLRVVLRTGPGPDRLPWELMVDPETQRFLALDARTPILRCLETGVSEPRPATALPLRILIAIAVPAGSADLDTEDELRRLLEAMQPLTASGAVVVEVARQATLDEVQARVASLDPHVLHFIGHGMRRTDGSGTIELLDERGTGSRSCTGADLAGVLAGTSTRLVVLNSCHGASNSDTNPFAGPAAALVKAGLPAAVAMRIAVGDAQAALWGATVYDALARGLAIEEAITIARGALARRFGLDTGDWPAAVLYLGSSTDASVTASPMPVLDDDVQFTVSRLAELRAERWEMMLVHAHRGHVFLGPGGETVDPIQQVRQGVAALFGPDAPRASSATGDAVRSIAIGSHLLVKPELTGLECHPESAALSWSGETTSVRFDVRAPTGRVGTACEGTIRIYCGIVVVGEIRVELAVVAADGDSPSSVRDTVHRYQRIFPCFSPEDAGIVRTLSRCAEALGDRYMTNAIESRISGAPVDSTLAEVDRADLFQLFWSHNSMGSTTCRRQWETAVGMRRPRFINAVFWEEPFPRTDELPSDDLVAAATFTPIPLPGPSLASPSGHLWALRPSPRDQETERPRPPAGLRVVVCETCGSTNTAATSFCATCGSFLGLGPDTARDDDADGDAMPGSAQPAAPPAARDGDLDVRERDVPSFQAPAPPSPGATETSERPAAVEPLRVTAAGAWARAAIVVIAAAVLFAGATLLIERFSGVGRGSAVLLAALACVVGGAGLAAVRHVSRRR